MLGNGFSFFLIVDAVKLSLDFLALLAVLPHLRPVAVGFAMRACTNDLEHVLCRIFLITAPACACAFEIVEQSPGIVSNITKVDRPATFGQKEQAIELLKQYCRRLVDCRKDSLPAVCELAQEGNDGP